MPVLRIFGVDLFQQVFDYLLFVIARRAVDPLVAVFQLIAFVDEQGHVAAVVDHQLGTLAALMIQSLERAPPVLFQRLALPGEHRHAGGSNRRRSMVLRGEDIATGPAHFSAQAGQRLNQHCGLNGHVQRPGHTHTGQRLLGRILVANRHQAGHLVLGDCDFLASPIGQGHVGDFVSRSRDFQC